MNVDISVIVPTCNGGFRHLRRCLDAVTRQQNAPAYEVIVVDSSTDDTAAVPKSFSNCCHVRLAKPALGIAARGEGIRRARGKFIAFTDHDCVPELDWLKRHAELMTHWHDCLGAGGAVTNASAGNPWGTADYLLSKFWLGAWYPPSWRYEVGTENAFFRRELFDKIRYVGETKEGISHSFLGDQTKRLGIRLRFEPGIRVGHINAETEDAFVRHQLFLGSVVADKYIPMEKQLTPLSAVLKWSHWRFQHIARIWKKMTAAQPDMVETLRATNDLLGYGCAVFMAGSFGRLSLADRGVVLERAAGLQSRIADRQSAMRLIEHAAHVADHAPTGVLFPEAVRNQNRVGTREWPVMSFMRAMQALLEAEKPHAVVLTVGMGKK